MVETAAIELLKRAVQLDGEQKSLDALTCYSEGIQMLLKAVKDIPLTEERKRAAYREKITEYMERAEQLKELMQQQKALETNRITFTDEYCDHFIPAKNYHEQIQIKDGSIGNSYEKIFSRFLVQTVTQITVQDPYIRAFHQISNFLRFCETVVKSSASVKRIDLITSTESSEQARQVQIDQLNQFKEHLARKHSIELVIQYQTGLHDREIRFNNGWIVKIGRGLDFYKPPECKFSIGYYDLDLRPCHQTTIDIFHSEAVYPSSS